MKMYILEINLIKSSPNGHSDLGSLPRHLWRVARNLPPDRLSSMSPT